jgi:hypothetical protein
MAYNNWGAFVYCNGERRKDKEDVGVFDTDEANLPSGARIFANILKNWKNQSDDPSTSSRHAVLGDKEIRLCGYKVYPELWRFRDGKAEQILLVQFRVSGKSDDEISYEGKIDGFEFSAYQYNDNMLDLCLIEPDGTEWKSTCGMSYGAGYMD